MVLSGRVKSEFEAVPGSPKVIARQSQLSAMVGDPLI
jgi:hypothetical protein